MSLVDLVSMFFAYQIISEPNRIMDEGTSLLVIMIIDTVGKMIENETLNSIGTSDYMVING